MPVAEKL
jgi:hypothetical protein